MRGNPPCRKKLLQFGHFGSCTHTSFLSFSLGKWSAPKRIHLASCISKSVLLNKFIRKNHLYRNKYLFLFQKCILQKCFLKFQKWTSQILHNVFLRYYHLYIFDLSPQLLVGKEMLVETVYAPKLIGCCIYFCEFILWGLPWAASRPHRQDCVLSVLLFHVPLVSCLVTLSFLQTLVFYCISAKNHWLSIF